MADTFNAALAFVWRPDIDGQPIHLTPTDTGGWTSYGATYRAWASWRTMAALPCSLETFKLLPRDSLQPFFHQLYWNATRCNDLPVGVDLIAFDAAVLSGPHRAILQLQGCVGVVADGIIGQATLSGVAMMPADLLVDRLSAARMAFLDTFDPRFRRGWSARVAAAQETAHQWLSAVPTV